MSASVSNAWSLTLLACASLPWWWPVWRALLADLRAAAGESASPRRPHTGTPLGPDPVADSRVPPNRLLAFQGVRRRVAARARWEAGFGRRGL